MSGVVPWEEPIPDCSDCRWYTAWLIDFPCRTCKIAFSENKTNYFEQKDK